jgi:DNA-binding transcriptional regulator LsrR (DeoR family)
MAFQNDNTYQLLRLATRIARLYHEQGLTQPEIATQLCISQTRVSRMLKFAQSNGIVRTTVHVPAGIFSDLEEQLQRKYGIAEFVVVDAGHPSDDSVMPALASSAAAYFEMAIPSSEIVGISSWSETLLAAVDVMRPLAKGITTHIVQVFGGVGRANSQMYATRLTERFAQLANARAMFLLVPSVVSSPEVRETLLQDPSCRDVFSYYNHLSILLVGIGSLMPSRLLRDSGDVITSQEIEELQASGAVGDVCLRYFDSQGEFIDHSFNERVMGISASQIRATPRCIAVAGGLRKLEAIRAALRGKWITTLITDLEVAQKLLVD